MKSLSGKVAVITGASRGIGRSIAIELAKAGASIIVNYKNNEEAAKNTLEIIKSLDSFGILVKGDVSIYDEAKFLIDKAIEKFGKIDILVNNAGISKIGLFIDMNEKEWDNIIDINLKGVINGSHNALKYMVSQKSGTIINISSMWGNVGASCEAVYSATKGAVNLFTKALAKEMAPANIRINAVAPGVIDTEMNNCLSVDEKKELEEEIPIGRFGEGEDIGKTVVFLASEASKYITGQVITVDGGMI
ncbi:elongation factor P 5-aminopentanone reductase [Clostridium magnum]|uniref:3-oxoacyl-[acyl-carrier-protein] reductase FabG n=1 Tax=Clostridium magnum DSM 2767 TaxID=1121326 RepID=A0A162S5A1_9CLOT|nr:SDR family oxidoreductase [Clostridium magnum]KZL90790.1 3-oxoacyl-[acyl-carrier-protein] reductase FabG [Clostridium magnum DSM 2767]SHI11512.1 3-oxoacyl-[acyl-carrier protein] reductase [Clostridium magnum DSM 2767]